MIRVHVITEPDFDNEVQDVTIIVRDSEGERHCWVRGFDDDEWEQAEQYAKQLASVLNVDFIDAQ